MSKKTNNQDIAKLRSQVSPILLTIFSAGLTGCMTSPSLRTQDQTTTSGTVVKGLLEGAEVFIDVDGDGVWTQGVDSAKATTNAQGEYSITSDKTGDIVAVTNSNTIDKSSGEVLDGITLSAPEGYDVISVASTLTNELMAADNTKTAAQAEADVKSLLGISSSIDISDFNPFASNVNAADAASYEKVAQQVMTVINGLATAESSFDSNVSIKQAFNNALDAMLDVVTTSIAQPSITPLDFTSGGTLVDTVISNYSASSALRLGGNSGTVSAIKNAINATNDENDNISSLGADSKSIFSVAQKNLIDAISDAATNNDATQVEDSVNSNLSIAKGNTAPTATAIADQIAVEDVAFTLNISSYFSDTESDTITYKMRNAPDGLSIDANTGVISGTPTNDAVGNNTVTIIATDSNHARTTKDIKIEVRNTNDAVTLDSAIADASTAEDAAYSYDTSDHFADVDAGDTGTYALSGAPSNLTIDASTGVISGTPNNDDVGTHTITVTRTDAGGATASDTFDLTVTNTNDVPTVTNSPIADATTDTSTAVNINVTSAFTDVDSGDTLSYSMTGHPDGLTINSSTGVISGTPTVAGTHSITVTADDGNGGTVTDSFDLNVQQVVDGAAIKGELENALVFIDADGDGVWTEGVDSHQVRTDANGNFSLTTHIRGDLVVTTDENTIDASSGATLTGVTLTAPEGYSVISVATTLTNQLMDSGTDALSAADAEAKVKTLLGIDENVDVTSFNPYDSSNAGSAEAIAYEKKAQQVMTVVNTLAEAEASSSETVEKDDALGNALEAFVSVVAEQDTTAGAAMDLTAGIVDQVVAAYGEDSDLKTGLDTSVLGAIETAIETVNTAIDSVTSLDADSKQLFAAAQVALLETTKDVAANNDATNITIDASTDVSKLIIAQGTPEKTAEENGTLNSSSLLELSDTISVSNLPQTYVDLDFVIDSNFGTPHLGNLSFVEGQNGQGTWTYTIDPSLAKINGLTDGESYSESFKVNILLYETDNTTVTSQTTKTITLYIDGQNDTPTVSSTINDVNIDEGTAITAIDVSRHFTDVESTKLTYEIDNSAREWLTIDANTGIITGTPENDQVGTQTITVTATDEQGSSVSTSFDIVVANVNDAPEITSVGTANVDENTATTNVIYTAAATDIDAGDTITYSLSGDDADKFTINASNGEIKLKSAADYETQTSYKVTVTATDSGTPALTDSQNLVITVNNVNEAPTITSDATAAVDENVSTGATAYKTTATDPEGESILYALSGTDASSFNINTSTGEVTFKAAPDFETKDSYSFDIEAQDISGLVSGADAVTKTITLTINDVNEAPVINSAGTASVDENDAVSTAIYTAQASDVDAGDAISYSLEGTDADQFSINTDSGALTLKNSANYENQDTYKLTLIATDNGGLEVKKNLTISVVDQNDDPTGTVTISGTAEDNSTLTAITSTIADEDDLGDFSYQWMRDGANITGATDATYDVNDDDVGSVISVKVSYTDGFGTAESLTSADTATVTDVNDAPTGAVTITGTAAEDETLTAVTSTIADEDDLGTFSYQWYSNDTAISGANSSTYTLTQAEVDTKLSVKVSYTDGSNYAESLTSDYTAVVSNVNDAPVGSIDLSGTVADNQTLSSTLNFTDEDGLDSASYSYQWMRDGVDISGATGTSFEITDTDVGAKLSVKVTYTDDQGTTETVTSDQTIAVVDVNDAPTGEVTISGTATEDETLTAITTTIADEDDLGTFSYQWFSDDTAITDATSSTYKLTQDEVGSQISVKVSYTDGFNTAESLTSNKTVAVSNVNDAPVGDILISGTIADNEQLSAMLDFTDEDGLSSVSSADYQFQWLRDGVEVTGENTAYYDINDIDVGKKLSVKVTYTDDLGTAESITSDESIAVVDVNDVPTGAVTISGTAEDNSTLTAVTSTIADEDDLGTFSYQWLRDGTNISGATNATYDVNDDDVGSAISVKVSYTDGSGTAESLTSTATATVTDVNDAPTGAVTISGTVTEDDTLTAVTSTIADEDDLGDFSYQWFSNGTAISGANASTYTLTQDEVGTKISVKASYTDGSLNLESLTSAQTDLVSNVNDAPTGSIDISGTIADNQTITANLNFDDEDGIEKATPSYQWMRDGVDIYGATSSTFEITDADVDAKLSVKVTYTDDLNTAESVTSSATITVADVNDDPTGAVTISGTAEDNSTLTAVTSTIADEDDLGTFAYQWMRDGADITDATQSTYDVTDDDVGAVMSVKVSYTDGSSTAESLTSADTAIVTDINDAPTGTVLISGNLMEGETLTANNTLADEDGLGTLSYQWFRGDNAITNAISQTYDLTATDVGELISVRIAYDDDNSFSESVTSAKTTAIQNFNYLPTGNVTISGVIKDNELLTADTTGIADQDGISGDFTFQWLRDDVAISYATNRTYRLTDDDVGAAITVKASYTDDDDNTHTLTSSATVSVVDVNDAPTGEVIISGTAEDKNTLTAITSTIDDEDDLGDFSYQWFSNDSSISGATRSIYTLRQDEVGTAITVEVSYIDGLGTAETLISDVTSLVTNVNDAPTGSVAINGTATQGQTLIATNTLADIDGLGEISYQWQRNGEAVTEATSSTYLLAQDDVGSVITVTASYTDGFNAVESVTSSATSTVANLNDLPDGIVSITGNTVQGATLTITDTISDEDGLGTFTYQWYADGAAIADTNNTKYILGQNDVGKQLSASITYTDQQDTTETVYSGTFGQVISLSNTTNYATGELSLFVDEASDSSFLLYDASSTFGLRAISLDDNSDLVWNSISQPSGISYSSWDEYVGQADLDSDGYSDLIGLSASGELVSVILDASWGATNTSSLPPSYVNTSIIADFVTTADIDGDGNEDLIYDDGNGIFFAWGNGDGSFANEHRSIPLENFSKIICADFNNDGYNDLLGYGNSISLTLGDGTGSFSTPTVLGTGDVAVGDLNNDGILDYVSSGHQHSLPGTYLGVGDGSFTHAYTAEGVYSYYYSVELADFNGDSILDLVFAGSELEDGLMVRMGQGDGQFGEQQRFGTGNGAYDTLVVADFDGDGDIDIAASATTLSSEKVDYPSIFLNTGGSFIPEIENTNDAPTGAATISGTATENETLTAITSTFADEDGLGTFSYQWFSDDTAITGAISNSYILTQAEVGSQISVKVSYTDGFNTSESLTSVKTAAVNNVNDAPTGSVDIAGTVADNQTLTANLNFDDEDGIENATATYQWMRNGVDISGATAATFDITDADVGAKLSVKVSYTDDLGTEESVTSTETVSVVDVNDAPTIQSGSSLANITVDQDQAVSVDASIFEDEDGDTLNYSLDADSAQTFSIDANGLITGTPGNDEVGGPYTVTVTANDGNGGTKEADFQITVNNVNDAPTGSISLTGNYFVGEQLGLDFTGFDDVDGLTGVTYNHQWVRVDASGNETNISGANSSTYTTTQTDIGYQIYNSISYTDNHSTAETFNSDSSTAIKGIPTVFNVTASQITFAEASIELYGSDVTGGSQNAVIKITLELDTTDLSTLASSATGINGIDIIADVIEFDGTTTIVDDNSTDEFMESKKSQELIDLIQALADVYGDSPLESYALDTGQIVIGMGTPLVDTDVSTDTLTYDTTVFGQTTTHEVTGPLTTLELVTLYYDPSDSATSIEVDISGSFTDNDVVDHTFDAGAQLDIV